MTCDDHRAAFLSGDDGGAFERHVEACASCRSDRGRLERLRSELANAAQWHEPGVPADRMIDAVLGRHTGEVRRRSLRRLAWALAAVALAASSLAVVALATRHPADWNVALSGAEAAPDASGTVAGWNVTGGSQLVLTTTGLDPAPDGSVYELWFMSGDEAVSAGTFTDPGEVRLMVGVPWREYPNVLVTLQGPSDASPSDTWLLWNDWSEEER